MDNLFTVKELAHHFKCTDITIIRWIKDGKLRGFKIKRRWYVPEKSVIDMSRAVNGGVKDEKDN